MGSSSAVSYFASLPSDRVNRPRSVRRHIQNSLAVPVCVQAVAASALRWYKRQKQESHIRWSLEGRLMPAAKLDCMPHCFHEAGCVLRFHRDTVTGESAAGMLHRGGTGNVIYPARISYADCIFTVRGLDLNLGERWRILMEGLPIWVTKRPVHHSGCDAVRIDIAKVERDN